MNAHRSLLLGISLLLAACSAVRVRPADPRQYEQRRRADVLNAGALSAATRESLRIVGAQEDGCAKAPQPCLHDLAATLGLDDERRLSASAELWLAAALGRDQVGRSEQAVQGRTALALHQARVELPERGRQIDVAVTGSHRGHRHVGRIDGGDQQGASALPQRRVEVERGRP